jgi:hypothetical protein
MQTGAKNRARWRILVEAQCSAAELWDAIIINNIKCTEYIILKILGRLKIIT